MQPALNVLSVTVIHEKTLAVNMTITASMYTNDSSKYYSKKVLARFVLGFT